MHHRCVVLHLAHTELIPGVTHSTHVFSRHVVHCHPLHCQQHSFVWTKNLKLDFISEVHVFALYMYLSICFQYNTRLYIPYISTKHTFSDKHINQDTCRYMLTAQHRVQTAMINIIVYGCVIETNFCNIFIS
jgi:hypothetical protein